MPRICLYLCLMFSEPIVASGAMVLHSALSLVTCCSLRTISDGNLVGRGVVGG